ncbi:ABC transporter ATP-binding protein [Streptomyces avicenniae]|uniref:ABC transporter ATP-binding protein n=1 Tax=Streptomyces avicenniae TaxID=500153 RepID=UPI00069A40CB|nr:ABC transporter ATP-binding protein [Streptomyces avicenniae]
MRDPATPLPPSPADERSTVRSLLRLRPYVRPVRLRLLLATLLATAASCLGLVMPLVLKWMADGPLTGGDPSGVWWGGLALLLLGAAEAAVFGLRRRLVARPLAEVEATMREALHHHVQRLPLAFHDRWPSGQLLSRATSDVGLIHVFLALPLTFLVVNTVTLLVGCVVLLSQQWTLGLLTLAPAVPLLVVGSRFEARYALASRRAQDRGGDLTTVVEESVLGIRVLKGLGRHEARERVVLEAARRVRAAELGKARLLAGASALFVALPESAVGLTLVAGAYQVADGSLSPGTLLAFLATALVLRPVVESMGSSLALSHEAATAVDRYLDVMALPVPQDRAPVPAPTRRAASEAGPVELAFENVEFQYPDAPPDAPAVLRGVTLCLAPGETLALVGATGSGKTTLTALVPRLYEPTAGRLTMDGRDIAAMTRADLRGRVAVAFEDPALFSATVTENVAMGARNATDADIARALRVARADEFVRHLPDGTATTLGERGLTLSGGQRQRLALARAVVGRPRLLVLDDPLSALDLHTEAAVEAALREVLGTTTALLVAHRPSTVLLADRVALLSQGRIAAVGTHRELLRTNAEYARLMSAPAPLTVPTGERADGGRTS